MTVPGPDVALKRRAAPGPFMGRQVMGRQDMRGTGIRAYPGFGSDSDPAQASEVIRILPVLPGRDRQQGDREPTRMSTATDLCGAGHGPVRHDHRLGGTADDGMWSGRRASNSRPQAWEAGALPTELRPHSAHCTMIFARLPSSPCLRGKPAAPSPQHVAADDAGSVREE